MPNIQFKNPLWLFLALLMTFNLGLVSSLFPEKLKWIWTSYKIAKFFSLLINSGI